MSFLDRYDPQTIVETVRDYLISNPDRARKARSVGLEDVVQETMINLLRYPPKRDVLLRNGCYWTASYTLKRMLNKRRPVSPAGLFFNMPDGYDEDMEELWDVIKRELPSAYDVLFRYFHGETQTSIAKRYGVHQSIIHTRINKWFRMLRSLEPSRAIQFFLTGEGCVRVKT